MIHTHTHTRTHLKWFLYDLMEEALGNSTWNALENKKRAVYTQKLIQLQFFFKERERERDRQNIPGIYRQNFGQGPGPCADIYRAKNVFVFFFLNDLNSNLIFFLNSIITRLVNTALARWINYLKFFLLIFFLRIFGGIFSDKGGNIEIYFLKKKW